MEQTEIDKAFEDLAELSATDLPEFLEKLAKIINERMRDYDSSLAKAILDFERGVVSLPELIKMAKEEV